MLNDSTIVFLIPSREKHTIFLENEYYFDQLERRLQSFSFKLFLISFPYIKVYTQNYTYVRNISL